MSHPNDEKRFVPEDGPEAPKVGWSYPDPNKCYVPVPTGQVRTVIEVPAEDMKRFKYEQLVPVATEQQPLVDLDKPGPLDVPYKYVPVAGAPATYCERCGSKEMEGAKLDASYRLLCRPCQELVGPPPHNSYLPGPEVKLPEVAFGPPVTASPLRLGDRVATPQGDGWLGRIDYGVDGKPVALGVYQGSETVGTPLRLWAPEQVMPVGKFCWDRPGQVKVTIKNDWGGWDKTPPPQLPPPSPDGAGWGDPRGVRVVGKNAPVAGGIITRREQEILDNILDRGAGPEPCPVPYNWSRPGIPWGDPPDFPPIARVEWDSAIANMPPPIVLDHDMAREELRLFHEYIKGRQDTHAAEVERLHGSMAGKAQPAEARDDSAGAVLGRLFDKAKADAVLDRFLDRAQADAEQADTPAIVEEK